MRNRRWLAPALAVAVVAAVCVAVPTIAGNAASGCAKVHSDFNGDGHADVATGASDLTGGEVGVYYTPSGSLTTKNLHAFGYKTLQPLMPPGYTLGDGDQIGYSLAPGYFNGDCYSDLAIGVPGVEGPTGTTGAVIILYGSASGLSVTSSSAFVDSALDPGATATTPDMLGDSLAAGNFNGDGYTDLAIGASQFQPNAEGAGGVAVIFGSSTGLKPAGQWWTQNSPGVPGANEPGDMFGFVLAAGDFTHDGRTDLAIGAPGESIGSLRNAGAVTILKGSPSGLTATGAQAFTQNTAGVPGTSEASDQFGGALAAGDITGDHHVDLVVGSAGESLGSVFGAGDITVLKGTSAGLTGSGSQVFSQNSAGVPGTPRQDGAFGFSLVAGDFNGDGHADVAVDALEDRPHPSVTILYGRSSSLTGSGAQQFVASSVGITPILSDDAFGLTIAALDVSSTSHADLVIGDPSSEFDEDASGAQSWIGLLHGGSTGVTTTGHQLISGAVQAPEIGGGIGLSLGR